MMGCPLASMDDHPCHRAPMLQDVRDLLRLLALGWSRWLQTPQQLNLTALEKTVTLYVTKHILSANSLGKAGKCQLLQEIPSLMTSCEAAESSIVEQPTIRIDENRST